MILCEMRLILELGMSIFFLQRRSSCLFEKFKRSRMGNYRIFSDGHYERERMKDTGRPYYIETRFNN